ncbi:hypothetical protein CBR_g37512 [Chara braunii]|uniref:Uncharacterized protein n=1 Tax=Chara braunii TaxID=69332 RepID=A0A388LN60_CHABU|nr:hypothetical protein CBR_g37512 [Chara braunii]|eukprot:GBG83711.1 hypothetical protein CBR_g37512 [Chara braunii]
MSDELRRLKSLLDEMTKTAEHRMFTVFWLLLDNMKDIDVTRLREDMSARLQAIAETKNTTFDEFQAWLDIERERRTAVLKRFSAHVTKTTNGESDGGDVMCLASCGKCVLKEGWASYNSQDYNTALQKCETVHSLEVSLSSEDNSPLCWPIFPCFIIDPVTTRRKRKTVIFHKALSTVLQAAKEASHDGITIPSTRFGDVTVHPFLLNYIQDYPERCAPANVKFGVCPTCTVSKTDLDVVADFTDSKRSQTLETQLAAAVFTANDDDVRRAAEGRMAELDMHRHVEQNGLWRFYRGPSGDDPQLDYHLALQPDRMHTIEHGIFLHMIDAFRAAAFEKLSNTPQTDILNELDARLQCVTKTEHKHSRKSGSKVTVPSSAREISTLKERNESPPSTPVRGKRGSGAENRPPRAPEKRSRDDRNATTHRRTKKRISYKDDRTVETIDIRGSDDRHSGPQVEEEEEHDRSASEKSDGAEDEESGNEGDDSNSSRRQSQDTDEDDDSDGKSTSERTGEDQSAASERGGSPFPSRTLRREGERQARNGSDTEERVEDAFFAAVQATAKLAGETAGEGLRSHIAECGIRAVIGECNRMMTTIRGEITWQLKHSFLAEKGISLVGSQQTDHHLPSRNKMRTEMKENKTWRRSSDDPWGASAFKMTLLKVFQMRKEGRNLGVTLQQLTFAEMVIQCEIEQTTKTARAAEEIEKLVSIKQAIVSSLRSRDTVMSFSVFKLDRFVSVAEKAGTLFRSGTPSVHRPGPPSTTITDDDYDIEFILPQSTAAGDGDRRTDSLCAAP